MTTPTHVHGPNTLVDGAGGGDARTGTVVLGRYELRERVGHGRAGALWRAHDLLLRRDVALQTLRTSCDRDPEYARWRAHHEGRAAAQVHHPCLASLYDMADLDGDVVLVSEFLRGRALDEVLATTGALPPLPVATFGAHLAEGLAVAHVGGVVHGDVTPTTVLLGLADDGRPDGTAALADFGVAGIDHGRASSPFVPPEVARGATATPASDVWALGATLATAVEGRPPFGPAGSAGAAPLWRAGPLAPVLIAMLSPDPDRRPDARWVCAALEAIVDAPEAGDATAHHQGIPVDGEAHTAPQARVPAAVAHPPTRTWTPRTDPRPVARRRRRLIGASVLGVGVLAAGTVGAVAATISEAASTTTALPVPALSPVAPQAPVVTAPITPPADPGPPIVAVPMQADPLLAAASQDASRHRSEDDDDRDRSDGDRRHGSDRDSDDDDRGKKKDRDRKHSDGDSDEKSGDGDSGDSGGSGDDD